MPSKSKAQQHFFGLVRSVQKGETPRSKVGKSVRKAADNMKVKDVRDFASTKTKKLPKKVNEVRLTETQLRSLIRECVQRALFEERSPRFQEYLEQSDIPPIYWDRLHPGLEQLFDLSYPEDDEDPD